MKIELILAKTKDTKGTYVYSTETDGAAVRSVYIQRAALGDKPPASIKLTIEEAR